MIEPFMNVNNYTRYTIDELHNLLEIYDNFLTESKEEPYSDFNFNTIKHFEEVVAVIRKLIHIRSH